jgi:hypothetical protein
MMKKILENKPRLFFGIGFLAVLILVIIGLVYGLKDNETMAIVGSEKITKTEYKERLYGVNFSGTPENPDSDGTLTQEEKDNVFKTLIEEKIINQELLENEKAYTEEEFKSEAMERLGESGLNELNQSDDDLRNKLMKTSVEYGIWKKRIENRVVYTAEGDLIIARFDKYADLAPEDLTAAEKAKWESEREANYNSDKVYATAKINEIYAKLSNGSQTPEEAIEDTLKDNRLNQVHFDPWTAALSDTFSKEDFINGNEILGNAFIREAVLNSNNGINQPIIVKGLTDKEEEIEALWLIVNLKEKSSEGYDNYDEWLESFYEKDGFIKIIDPEFEKLIATDNVKGVAYAHSGSHGCSNTNHWGVNTGTSSSTAGLKIYTRYYNSSGAGPYPINSSVTVTQKSSETTDTVRYTPRGTNTSGARSRTFTTGDYWWYNYNSSSTSSARCANSGWAVLGYGSTSGSGLNGHFGNRYTLGCKGSPFTVTAANHTSRVGGKWDAASQSVGVSNGYTSSVTFTWRDNRPPRPYRVAPANNSTITIPSGSTTASVAFRAKATDPDGNTVKFRYAYRKQNANGTWGSWVYRPSETTWTPTTTQNTDFTMETRSLDAGYYNWLVKAADQHGLQNLPPSGQTNEWLTAGHGYFTVGAAIRNISVTTTGGREGENPGVITSDIRPRQSGTTYYITGLAGTPLEGKFVYGSDIATLQKWHNSTTEVTTDCGSPQCLTGIDPSFPTYPALVGNDKNNLDFTTYPARNACKAIGGRLPNQAELSSIITNKSSYGNNFKSLSTDYYWTNLNASPRNAGGFRATGEWIITDKIGTRNTRCVADVLPGPINCNVEDGNCASSHPSDAYSATFLRAVPNPGYTFKTWRLVASSYTGTVWGQTLPATSTSNPVGFTRNYSWTVEAVFEYTANPTLSCTVYPDTGDAPLNLMVTANFADLDSNAFDYRFTGGQGFDEMIINKGSMVEYPLPSPGDYQVYVRNSSYQSGNWIQCSPATVNVTTPFSGGGGERS